MAIEDVIRDLNIYFDSMHKPVQLRAHMGGAVNPSYLNVQHGNEHTVLTFWSVAGGSDRERDLAKAFKEDIEAWLNKLETDHAVSQRTIEQSSQHEHQDGDGGRQAAEAGRRDRNERGGKEQVTAEKA